MKKIITLSGMEAWSDYAPLVLRVATGIIFAFHGWQKLQGGLAGTAGLVQSIGFPMPELFAVLLIAAELGGGILLILGLFTRWSAIFTGFVALVAVVLVHLPNGFSMATGGYEYVFLLLAASIALVLSGGGKWSLDRTVLK